MNGEHKFCLARTWSLFLPMCLLVTFANCFIWDIGNAAVRLTTLHGASWPDFVSGQPVSVAVEGPKAYVGLRSGGLVILDISNPTNCVRLGGYDSGYSDAGSGGGVAVAGGCAFFAAGFGGMHVVAVTNPVTPVRVAQFGTNIAVSTLALSSDLLYVPSYGRLDVLTVTNPAAPVRVGGCTTTFGSPVAITVSGGYAYVVDEYSLFVLAVTNPAAAFLVGQISVPGTDVAVSGGYAYVTGLDGTMHVIAVTNPAAPVWVAGITNYGASLFGIAASSDTVCWCGGGVFFVASITNPAMPMLSGVCSIPGGVQGIAISGNYAFLANGSIGLQVIGISDPSQPNIVGGYRTGKSAWKVAASSDYAYVAVRDAGLRVVAVTNPAAPVVVGGYDPENFHFANGIVLANGCAYLLSYSQFDIFALTNPANPTRIGTLGLPDPGGVAIAGNYAYIADAYAGLSILDLSNPAAPAQVGSSKYTTGYARGVAVDGGYAYVAYGSGGLQVFGVSNPANPVWVGGYDTGGDAEGIAVSNGIAYVAARNAGVQIFSITNPANPVLLSSFDINHDCWDVTLAGNYAYVADNGYGVEVMLVTNPAAPVQICTLPASGAIGVSVVGSRIYVADSVNGLLIYCTVPQLQFTARVEDGTPGLPLTIETATNLTDSTVWTPVFTTNCPAGPFEFTDSQISAPQKFYRAWQP